jgi:cysteine desulfurase
MTYLDANASETLRPEARAAVLAALATEGNPSSVHAAGRAARRVLETAREQVAACFGAAPADVVFTSGGTEANALAMHALGAGRRVIIGATEHDAVRAAAPRDAAVLPVDGRGVADLAALGTLLAAGPALVCLMLANNETGVVHPVAEAAALCRAHGALLHVDAVQAAGRLAVDIRALGADSVAISGHKMGGPLGAGALILSEDRAVAPLLAGGGQERGRRGGTPALPAIAGLAAAARAAVAGLADQARLAGLRDAIEAMAAGAGAVVAGAGAPRLGNTTNLALQGARAETQVIALDLAGFQVSAGAACSSGKVAASHVLLAMGLEALAGSAVRVSLPWNARAEDAERFAAAYLEMARRLSRRAA